jgi:5'-3' exonuclease
MVVVPKVSLKPSKSPVMLVDTSYYVFYRYFATFNWFKKQVPDINGAAVMSNERFALKYMDMFEKTFLNLCKTHKIQDCENVVFVKDCPRDKIWRHSYIGGYKENREMRSDTFDSSVFPFTYQNVLPRLEERYGIQVLGHDSLEADDVVAIVAKDVMDKTSEPEIVVITNDNDYIQLLNHDNAGKLLIENLQGKEICQRVGCDPKTYIEVKKIMGDKSDNIPAIFKKCGGKTALKLAQDEQALESVFKKIPDAKKQYDLNNLCIDFKCIPNHLRTEIVDRLNIT